MQPAQLTQVPLQSLQFDPQNPRLPMALRNAPDTEILDYLLLECGLIELMLSIGQQDFFIGEPLLVVEVDKGMHIVVEGNRRLGALKLLSNLVTSSVMTRQVEQVRAETSHRPTSIPVLKFNSRDDILTYLGYRHITGIKPWDSLAKARYLKQLKDRHNLDNDQDAHRVLAREIGSKAPVVAKLLAGLHLLEHAKEIGLLKKLNLKEESIPFSYLTTGIGYENICKFIGLEDSSDVSAKQLNEKNFEEFFTWIFDKSQGQTVLGESRNLEKLARVVANEQSLIELRNTRSLDTADLYTSGPLEAIRNLMTKADNAIEGALSVLASVKEVEESDLTLARRIENRAKFLTASIQSLTQDSAQ